MAGWEKGPYACREEKQRVRGLQADLQQTLTEYLGCCFQSETLDRLPENKILDGVVSLPGPPAGSAEVEFAFPPCALGDF